MKQYIYFKVRHLSIFKYSFHSPNTVCNAETKQLAKFACLQVCKFACSQFNQGLRSLIKIKCLSYTHIVCITIIFVNQDDAGFWFARKITHLLLENALININAVSR